MVYQTPEQLRTMPLLTLDDPPAVFPIVLSGLDPNQDGLYAEEDMLDRLDQAIEAYDTLVENYSEVVPAEEPVMAVVP